MAGRSTLVFDLETVVDTGLWSPPPDDPEVFPPQYAHRIIAIGAMLLDPSYACVRLGIVEESKDERGMLADFMAYIERHKPVLVTFNGRTFDVPVLAHRCLRHGVAMAWYFRSRDYRYRYAEEAHFDLCDQMAEYGAARSPSLDTACRMIGLPGKIDVDGTQVARLYQEGKLDKVQVYCLADVIQTAFLFLRHRLLTGHLDLEAYRKAASALLAKIEEDGRFGSLLAAIQRPHLLVTDAP